MQALFRSSSGFPRPGAFRPTKATAATGEGFAGRARSKVDEAARAHQILAGSPRLPQGNSVEIRILDRLATRHAPSVPGSSSPLACGRLPAPRPGRVGSAGEGGWSFVHYLYLFCVEADARDNDSVATIDVGADSLTYGTITFALDLGPMRNETQHWGYTDDRTRIWAGGLGSGRIWLLDVATDPARLWVERILADVPKMTGLSGPHAYHALPGRMLLTFLGAERGGLLGGMAEFTNDGRLIRTFPDPGDAPERRRRGREAGAGPDGHQWLTPGRNYIKPPAKMDFKDLVKRWWPGASRPANRSRAAKAGDAPPEVRWSLKPGADHGFTTCAHDNSLWLFKGKRDRSVSYEFRKVADTAAMPADIRQSPDDRYLFVSCFGANVFQKRYVTVPERLKHFSSVSPCVQPIKTHVTGFSKRR